jgi:hypothetical protein
VRSNQLEALLDRDAFRPEWREVVLLAAGELGVVRADDARLEALVDRVIVGAARKQGKPSSTVPSLLAGLLADDPGLTQAAIQRIAQALVPTWWFERGYSAANALGFAVREATQLVQDRIQEGRAAEALRGELVRYYGNGIGRKVYANLARGGPNVIAALFEFLAVAGVDYGPSLLLCAREDSVGKNAIERYRIRATNVQIRDEVLVANFLMSRMIDTQARSGSFSAMLHYRFWGASRSGQRTIMSGECDWQSAVLTGEVRGDYVMIELRHNAAELAEASRCYGNVSIKLIDQLTP